VYQTPARPANLSQQLDPWFEQCSDLGIQRVLERQVLDRLEVFLVRLFGKRL
jgi:hypothetical protein